MHERKKDLPNIDEADSVSQIGYCFDLDSDEIDKSDEDVKQDSERPEYDDAPNMDVESEIFDKFLGLYVEIPSLDKEEKLLGS